jgi:hypothetical protein
MLEQLSNPLEVLVFVAIVLILLASLFLVGYGKRARVLMPMVLRGTIRRAQLMRCAAVVGVFGLLVTALVLGVSHLFIFEKTGVIAYACDESRSMGAENDEGISRIERCKLIVQALDAFPHAHVAIYGFTDRAFSHSSFSLNHEHFQKTVQRLVAIEAVPGAGSELGFSLVTILEDTEKKRSSLEKKAAVVVLLSDGESTSGQERDDSTRAANYAKAHNITLVLVGVGEDEAQRIPVIEDGVRTGYEIGQNKQEIVTRRDERTLRYLAENTNGIYAPEQEVQKARAFLEQALVQERVKAQGAGNMLVSFLLLGALIPFTFFVRYTRL